MDAQGSFTLNTGAKIPAVGLGTWQTNGASCTAAVSAALEVGYRHLDCAHLYGNEIEVGQALAEALAGRLLGLRREDLFVTSKLWCTTSAWKRVETSIDISLKNLGLTYLDLYLVHWPSVSSLEDATDPPHFSSSDPSNFSSRMKSTWLAMEDLLRKGKVAAIGVSNFTIPQLEELLTFAKVVPAVNQVELHPFWRQDELVKFCQSKGIHVSAHTPLGLPDSSVGSCGTNSEQDDIETTVPVFSRSHSVHVPLLKTSAIASIAEHLGKTPAQVILRWGLQRGTSVLPRSLKKERIKSNFDIFTWSLSDEDWNIINNIEPQSRLIHSSHSFLSRNGPLEALLETDDDSEYAEND